MNETKTSRYRKRHAQLLSERKSQGWDERYTDIIDFFAHDSGRYLSGETANQHNNAERKDLKVINSVGADAALICINGLNSGLTPHWSPWFNFTLPDEDLVEYSPVRQWLHDARNVILTILSKSNYYSGIYDVYSELTHFATGAMLVEEDLTNFMRCRPFTIGEYCLTLDSSYKPESLYHQYAMTAGQIREEFGQGKDKMDGLPICVKTALKSYSEAIDQLFEVVHVIEKSQFVNPGRADWKSFPYRSIYYLLNDDEDIILREHGYRTIPFISPRWSVKGINTYGNGCPSMRKIGDCKMLQQQEKDKLEGLRKMIRPPMNAPSSMKNSGGGHLLSGAINYIDVGQGQQSFVPSYQIDPRFREIREDIAATEQRIKDGFFNNLFLAVLGLDKREVTAYEIAKRYEEKATVLGPILERMDNELRSPTIMRVLSIAALNGWLPPLPRELSPGMELKIEYTSSLSQAQKVVQGQPVQEFLGVIGQLIEAFPEARHKVNVHEAVDQLGVNYNLPPNIIRSDDEVEAIMQQEQQQQQMMQLAEQAKPMADAVKSLGNTPVQNGQSTALDAMGGAQ